MTRSFRFRLLLAFALLSFLPCAAQDESFVGQQSGSLQPASPLIVPKGTRIVLALMRPVASKSIDSGEPIYLQTTFPVLVDKKLAIPAGTFVQGVLALPATRQKHQVEMKMDSALMIFGNGYTVEIPGASGGYSNGRPFPPGLVMVSVDRVDDSSLLDIGSPAEIVLAGPMSLEESQLERSVSRPNRLWVRHDLIAASRPAANPQYTCFTPEVPPKRAIVIAGTPGTPDTPATPDTCIPAVPAKPGTPYRCP